MLDKFGIDDSNINSINPSQSNLDLFNTNQSNIDFFNTDQSHENSFNSDQSNKDVFNFNMNSYHKDKLKAYRSTKYSVSNLMEKKINEEIDSNIEIKDLRILSW